VSEKPPISKRDVRKKRERTPSPLKSLSKRNDLSASISKVSLSTAYLMQHKNMQNKVAKRILGSANGSSAHSITGTEDG
jgi:hypothetical protein